MKIVDGSQGQVFSYLRFSSDKQQWGDSERRQGQQALEWYKLNGRTLCEQTFADRGVSGWKGANRTYGALGALLKVAQDGDTILVEDCDRWSRESPLDSLNALRDTVSSCDLSATVADSTGTLMTGYTGWVNSVCTSPPVSGIAGPTCESLGDLSLFFDTGTHCNSIILDYSWMVGTTALPPTSQSLSLSWT
jgi:hypothetical protein